MWWTCERLFSNFTLQMNFFMQKAGAQGITSGVMSGWENFVTAAALGAGYRCQRGPWAVPLPSRLQRHITLVIDRSPFCSRRPPLHHHTLDYVFSREHRESVACVFSSWKCRTITFSVTWDSHWQHKSDLSTLITEALADIRFLSAWNGSENIRFHELLSCLHAHNTYPICATWEGKIRVGPLEPCHVNPAQMMWQTHSERMLTC